MSEGRDIHVAHHSAADDADWSIAETQRLRVPRETVWRVRSIGRPHDQLNVMLTADTTSETVCRAIEQAAANNGIVIERVEAQP